MFDMFKNMGAMAGVLSNLPKIQERMKEMQARLAQIVVEGDAGAGMVKALGKAREAMAEETGKLGESLGLPPGIKIPGLG
jgi:hypothetical protein